MDNATALIERLRRNRELKVSVERNGKTIVFACRRPTDVEAFALSRRGALYSEIALDYVTGWSDNVVEDDIAGGGGSDPVKFDRALWKEWCADWEACWTPIGSAVLDAWKAQTRALEDVEKN